MGEENNEETKEKNLPEEPANVDDDDDDDDQAKKKQERNKPPLPFVLCVDLHCMGCAKKVERSISKIRGVEAVVVDMTKNEVTIEGAVEPQAVCDRIMKKTRRTAKEVEGESIPDIVSSLQASGLTTVELNVNMHCEPCAAQLKKKILKMKGVRTAETELSSGRVTVTGTMKADHLVEYVYRHTKKQAKVVPQPDEPEEKETDEGKKDEKESLSSKDDESPAATDVDCESDVDDDYVMVDKKAEEHQAAAAARLHHDRVMMMSRYYQPPLYVMERVYAPQMFSDENPNACCIV